MELRPYQREAVAAVKQEWKKGKRKTLLVLPTGTGKTIVFANVARSEVRCGRKVLILAHRDELLQQAEDKILAPNSHNHGHVTTAFAWAN